MSWEDKYNRAKELDNKGHYHEAYPLYEEAILDLEEVRGEKHAQLVPLLADVGRILMRIADLMEYNGMAGLAIQLYEEALEPLKRAQKILADERRPENPRVALYLAVIHLHLGCNIDALPLLRTATAALYAPPDPVGEDIKDWTSLLNECWEILSRRVKSWEKAKQEGSKDSNG